MDPEGFGMTLDEIGGLTDAQLMALGRHLEARERAIRSAEAKGSARHDLGIA